MTHLVGLPQTEEEGVIGARLSAPTDVIGTGEILTSEFDYGVLSDDDATKLRHAADRIRRRIKRQLEGIIEVGRDLISVKETLQHGQFTRWLSAEFSWSDRTARNYMNVAEAFEGRTESISGLGPTVLYRLAAPSTPAETRESIIAMAEAGHPVTDKLVTKAIRRLALVRDPKAAVASPSGSHERRPADGRPGADVTSADVTAIALVALLADRFGADLTVLQAAVEKITPDAWIRSRDMLLAWMP